MNSRGLEVFRNAIAMIRASGATNIRHRYGGKHLRIEASYRGSRLVTFVPLTPSDWRSSRNSRAQLKRLIRAANQPKGI